MAACTSDADCASLVTGHWCTEAATCDAALQACVAWPRCRVPPWIGCTEQTTTPQCVLAQGPDGPALPLTAPADALGVLGLTGIAGSVLLVLAVGLALLALFIQRRVSSSSSDKE